MNSYGILSVNNHFQMLKQMLTQEPILVYPDPSKLYVLFTDASKYAWSCVLTQEYVYEIDGKEKKGVASYHLYEWIVQGKSNKLGMFD